jgi:PAS domain S-box-containing protein
MAAFDSIVDGLVVLVSTGGLSVVGAWLLRYKDQKAKNRQDVVSQLEQYAEGLRKRIDVLEGALADLNHKHVACQVENEGLRARLDGLQATVENLRGGMDPLYATIVNPIANLIFDQDGTVREATPFITSMFHWYESELIGRNFKRLLPARFHPEHDAWMRRCVETGQPPADRVLRLIGLTKQGREIPIYLRLRGWKDEAGHWTFNAFIQERPDHEGEISRDGIPIFEPPAGPAVPVVTVPDPIDPPPGASPCPPPA